MRARFLQWLLLRSEAVARWCEQQLGLAQPEPYKLVTAHLPGGVIHDYSNRLDEHEGWDNDGQLYPDYSCEDHGVFGCETCK